MVAAGEAPAIIKKDVDGDVPIGLGWPPLLPPEAVVRWLGVLPGGPGANALVEGECRARPRFVIAQPPWKVTRKKSLATEGVLRYVWSEWREMLIEARDGLHQRPGRCSATSGRVLR